MRTEHIVAAAIGAAGISVAWIVAAIVCRPPEPSTGPNPAVDIVNDVAGRAQSNACSLVLPWR